MKRLFLLGVFIILGISSGSPADGWSENAGFSRFPGLQFRWRVEPAVRSDGMNLIEYAFSNVSEAEIKFFYVIGTDSGEAVYGRIDLGANQTRLLGWMFEGSSITFSEAAEPELATDLMKEIGLVEHQPEAVP